MILSEAPIGSLLAIGSMPELPLMRERGICEGTHVRVVSKSRYGTLKIQVDSPKLPEILVRTLTADKIQVESV